MRTLDYVLFTFIYINAIILGYFLGSILNQNRNGVADNIPSFLKQKDSKKHESISINDKTFVVDIKTDTLEKKYDSLGDIKHSTEDISNSINKLKNLKR